MARSRTRPRPGSGQDQRAAAGGQDAAIARRLCRRCTADPGTCPGEGGKKSKAARTPHDAPTAHDIVKAVDRCVYDLQQGNGPEFGAQDEPDLVLGSLWGQQLVRELSWQWAAVTFHEHDDAKAVGVFSPDRALAIYPFHFIYGCLENGAEVTIMSGVQLLVDGSKVPPLAPGTYENVMDNVHYIVPRG